MVSNDFIAEMDRKIGAKPRYRVYFYPKSKEGGSPDYVDLSDYYNGLSPISQQKERSRSELSAGDITLRFFNKDNYFCEKQSNSVFYGEQYYHNRKIRVWAGLVLPDSTVEWRLEFTGLIIEIEISVDRKYAYIICQDVSKDLIQGNLNVPTSDMIPAPGANNVGDGTISDIATKPFTTKTENWTLTCTTAGGSGTGKFSVVGSVSGNVGEATVGTEFSTGTGAGGIKFTIYVGNTDFALNDTFTFTTRQYPEYTNQNLSDIIKDYLTNTAYGLGIDVASQINTASFDDAKTAIAVGLGNVTGYIPFNTNASTFTRHLVQLFFGSIYTNANGEICLKAWMPTFGTANYREFSRSRKIIKFSYHRYLKDVINQITIYYRKASPWAWSDETQKLDGMYFKEDAPSIADYGKRPYPENDGVLSSFWLDENAAKSVGDKIIDRYARPPFRLKFDTRLDALDSEIGDLIDVKESDAKLDNTFEITDTDKDLERKVCSIEAQDAKYTAITWAFLGSSADEGDGLSPQAANYDSASESNKQFCYLSQTGGEGSNPEYYLW